MQAHGITDATDYEPLESERRTAWPDWVDQLASWQCLVLMHSCQNHPVSSPKEPVGQRWGSLMETCHNDRQGDL